MILYETDSCYNRPGSHSLTLLDKEFFIFFPFELEWICSYPTLVLYIITNK